MAQLFFAGGRDRGKRIEINEPVCRIGRDPSNEVQLRDGEASRQHATLRLDSGQWILTDNSSSNGTRVNRQRIERSIISSGDRIEIGTTVLIFKPVPQTRIGDAAHGVDIVADSSMNDASRIVSSLSNLTSPIEFEKVVGTHRRFTPADPAADITAAKSRSSRSTEPVTVPSGPADENRRPPENETAAPPAAFSVQDSSETRNADAGESAFQIDADRSLEVMYRAAIAVGRTDDLDEVLQRVLRLVFDWIEADRGCVMLLDAETGMLHPAARCDRPNELSDSPELKKAAKPARRISISHTILDYVMEHKQGVRTSDAMDDERFDDAASIVRGKIREAICVPLQGRYGIVGALYVDTFSTAYDLAARGIKRNSQGGLFNDDHLRLITAIGHQAAIAIEDTKYYGALLQSERLAAMGQTIATLSHHVKNILQGIRGGSYLIDTGLQRDDNDAVRRGWSIVDRNQERISNLVMDMLAYSKQRVPQRSDADLNEVVVEVCELMQARAGQLGIEIRRHLEPDMPLASFDADAMHRAIMNLVTNAIDSINEHRSGSAETDSPSETDSDLIINGLIEIQTGCDSRGWTVQVRDNGPGVAPEDRRKIFSLFESAKGMRGTGLGLPVCAKIMQEHGGSIEVDDPGSGPGVVFRLLLPKPGAALEVGTSDTLAD